MSFSPNSIVTLTTDFGLDDPYVGIMKGVMLSLNPVARVVDISHGIPSHDIVAGALALRSSYSYFPAGTVHVVVVDPGVGGQRRPLMMVSKDYAFIGPDNGVLTSVLPAQQPVRMFHLTQEQHFLKILSSTFHGRDVFAPVAARVSSGTPLELFGQEIDNFVQLDLPTPRKLAENRLLATVLRIDKFGNLITNLTLDHLVGLRQEQKETMSGAGLRFEVSLGGGTGLRLCRSYSESCGREPFGILGSADLLEISVNQASAAELLHVRTMQEFEVRVLEGA